MLMNQDLHGVGMGWDLVALVVLYSCLFQAQLTCSDWAEKGDDEMEDGSLPATASTKSDPTTKPSWGP